MGLERGAKSVRLSSNCWDSYYNERKYVNMGKGLYYMRQIAGSGEIGDVHYTRTTASTRQYANQENKRQDPKSRRQMKLFNVGVLILLVPLSVCVPTLYVLYAYLCVRAH